MDILYLYKALETLVASKDILNPLQDTGPAISIEFPATASSSEGCGTATTIEMVVEGGPDTSGAAVNEAVDRRHSASASSNITSKYIELRVCL